METVTVRPGRRGALVSTCQAWELSHREGIVSLVKWSDVSVFEVLFEEMVAMMGIT